MCLYEKQPRLGGQLLLAMKPPFNGEIEGLIDFLTAQVEKHGARINVGQEATAGLVKENSPDAVVVATGALPVLPEIDVEGGTFLFPADVLAERVEIGHTVIIIGGGLVGAETAEFLARKNRQVSIVEVLDTICEDMPLFPRDDLLRRLRELRVNILKGTRVNKIGKNAVTLEKDKNLQDVSADTIVNATGSRANRKLPEELEGIVSELYMVGDCCEPRRLFEAIHEGFLVGNRI